MGDEFSAPYEPIRLSDDEGGPITQYCESPTNGRLEWIMAVVKPCHLNEGSEITDEMIKFLEACDKNPMDTPSLIIHKSIGGKGDEFWNCFMKGRSFDDETFDNDVESTVYYAVKQLKDEKKDGEAKIKVRFVFKDDKVTRPYKLSYQVELPSGDVIENDLPNV